MSSIRAIQRLRRILSFWQVPSCQENVKRYPYDPQKAKELLKEAGYQHLGDADESRHGVVLVALLSQRGLRLFLRGRCPRERRCLSSLPLIRRRREVSCERFWLVRYVVRTIGNHTFKMGKRRKTNHVHDTQTAYRKRPFL